MHPGRQPSAQVSTARYRGQIVKSGQQPGARQTLDHTQRESGAADPSTGQAQGRLAPAQHESVDCSKTAILDCGQFRLKQGLQQKPVNQWQIRFR